MAEVADALLEVAASCAPVDRRLPAALPRAVVRAAGVVGVDVVDRTGEAAGALAGDRRDGAAAEAGAGNVVLGAGGWFFAKAALGKAAEDAATVGDQCEAWSTAVGA